MGRRCGGGCFTCMKYNAMLLHARSEGLPDDRSVDAVLPPAWNEVRREMYFCEGMRAFRHHLREAVRRSSPMPVEARAPSPLSWNR